jgi:hypothetical protein
VLPRVPRLRILPPCSGELRRCHVSRGSGSCLPPQEGSDAAMCPTASDPSSLLKRAPELPCVPWLWILPPCSGELWCYHMSCGSGSFLPTREGTGIATCPVAPNPASLLTRAPTLPRIPRHQTSPPYSGGLWHCHVSYGNESCLPAWEGSSVATCPTTPDPASLLGRAPTLSRGSLWAANLKIKERLSWPTNAARLAFFQGMPARYRDA